jgi:hypothetical protein
MTKTKPTPTENSAFLPEWLSADAAQARALVEQAKDRGADLVAAWVACKNVAAVAAVAKDDGAPTAARKAARRGVNVLKSRGVAIPDLPREPRAAREPEASYEAWFRPPDAAGTSAFTLGARDAGGRYRLVDVITKDGAGIISVAGMEMSRTQLRETFEGIEQRFGHGPARVPIAWARARIAAARAANGTHGTPVPLGFENHGDLIGGATPKEAPHPADEAGLALPSRDEALGRSGTLHAEPELRGWLPEPAAMQSLLQQISEQKDVLRGADAAATQANVMALIERATDAYFTAKMREQTARRMKDAAISMLSRGETARAADLLVVAGVTGATDDVAPAHAVPFLRGFFQKAFGLAAARAARPVG